METKMIKVPFDVEMAKNITDGEIPGKIVTRDGRRARIACWNYKSLSGEYPLLALIENGIFEDQELYTLKGKEKSFIEEACDSDLMLEIPEYLTFKDGDVVVSIDDKIIGIYGYIDNNETTYYSYATLCGDDLSFEEHGWYALESRRGTKKEKQKLIDALKASKDPRAKECLKKLGVKVKSEYEFKPFDKVLVRQSSDDVWDAMLFCNYSGQIHKYRCLGMNYMYCIPYEGNEHLLGTKINPEEHD